MKLTKRYMLGDVARACRRFLDHYDAGADKLNDQETLRALGDVADPTNAAIVEMQDRWFGTLCFICDEPVSDDPAGYICGSPVHRHCRNPTP